MLLHGWSATADLNWFACFEPLARHFRVVAIDHRGHGRGLRTAEPFRLEDCADDAATLAHLLGIDRCVPVGYSMGGPIAQLLWRRNPGLVDGLVLCATSAHFSEQPGERVVFGVAAGVSAIGSVVPLRPFAGVALAGWCRWQRMRRRSWWGFDEIARHDWAQVVEAARALGRFDSRDWISDVSVPTAVLVTEDDEVVPTERQLAFAASMDGAIVRRVRGGHGACTITAERFAPALVDACLDVAGRGMLGGAAD
jgi:3-oxoadipate enol-lactonase